MVALLATGGACVALVAAAVIASLRVAALVLRPPTTRAEDVRVRHVDRRAGLVVLSRHPDAIVPGRYSLYFSQDRGWAQIGDIVSLSDTAVTRVLLSERRGRLRAGLPARVSGWFYESPRDLGAPIRSVVVTTPLGPAPAWQVDTEADSGRWVIQVHGRGVDRREGLRAVPVFRDSGYTSLLISYRNDGVAPASQDGRYALGDVEWVDVEAALGYAADQGATQVILMGWSMGGALVLQALTRSSLSRLVTGVVLESPVIDWVRVLDHQAGSLRVPRLIRSFVYRLISTPWGGRLTGQDAAIDLKRLDFVERAHELRTPILLMHSAADDYVPPAGADQLARLRPDIVSQIRFNGAGHTRLWNYDESRWNAEISDWLSRR